MRHVMKASISCRRLSSFNGLKVLFFGTDDFSVASLDALNKLRIHSKNISQLDVIVNANVQLAKNRNQVLLPPVLKYARTWNLHDICWKKFKLEQRLNDSYDLAVVASFGDFIPANIISSFSRGAINIHPSLLPRWRGSAPIVHTLLSSDQTTGISVITLSKKKFDVGDILLQKEVEIPEKCTYEQLLQCMSKMSAELIPFVIDNIDVLLTNATKQDERFVTHAPKIDKSIGYINFDSHSCADLERMQRALPENIGIRTCWERVHVKLGRIIKIEAENFSEGLKSVGEVRYDKLSKLLSLRMKDGWVFFASIRVQNRKEISATSFYNGYIVDKRTRQLNEITFENFST